MNWRRVCLTAVCCFAIGFLSIGCGDDDGDSNGGSGVSVDEPEDFTGEADERLLGAVCEGIFECPEKQNPEVMLAFSGFSDQQSCEAFLNESEALGSGNYDGLVEAAEDGRVTYSADEAEACLEDFDEATEECVAFEKIDLSTGACDSVFEGDKEEGDACLISEECADGECVPQSDPDICYGACEPSDGAGEGESCMPGDCNADEGLSCSSAQGDGECVANQSIGEGEACSQTIQCEGGLHCMEQECTQPDAPSEDGDACGFGDNSEVCAGGLTCQDLTIDQQTGSVEGVCGSPLQEGDACLAPSECERGLFCEGADFETGQEGECAPITEVGAACGNDEECGLFAECVDVDGEMTCRPNGEEPDGEQCELPDEEE